MKKVYVVSWLLLLLSGVIMLFWYNEWIFNLPTPVPKNYTAIETGTTIHLPGAETDTIAGKPVFLHFFNPDCPCSRFNIDHVRSLIKRYGNEVSFRLVLVSNKDYSTKEIQDRFNITIPVIHDTTIAALCGVYSTPQAVIIDNRHKLFYRGNYNRSRYCTDKKTNYAQVALEALMKNSFHVAFDQLAVKAYGCQLPGCRKE
ncbi:MAG: AhpC/TSA family protein [Bacteroidota bacterium]